MKERFDATICSVWFCLFNDERRRTVRSIRFSGCPGRTQSRNPRLQSEDQCSRSSHPCAKPVWAHYPISQGEEGAYGIIANRPSRDVVAGTILDQRTHADDGSAKENGRGLSAEQNQTHRSQ